MFPAAVIVTVMVSGLSPSFLTSTNKVTICPALALVGCATMFVTATSCGRRLSKTASVSRDTGIARCCESKNVTSDKCKVLLSKLLTVKIMEANVAFPVKGLGSTLPWAIREKLTVRLPLVWFSWMIGKPKLLCNAFCQNGPKETLLKEVDRRVES